MAQTKWRELHKQGSGSVPRSTDEPLNRDTRTDVENATRESDLHEEANKLADRSTH